MNLNNPIERLPYVGPTYAKRLEKLEIKTVEDLLYHFPFRYDDFSLISSINHVQPGEIITVTASVDEIKNEYTKGGRIFQKATVSDKTGSLEILWFNQPFLPRTIRKGETYNFSGKVDWFGRKIALISPEYEKIISLTPNTYSLKPNPCHLITNIHTGRLVPIYNETYGISSKWLRNRIKNTLTSLSQDIQEFLPEEIIKRENLLSEKEALLQIHFPDNQALEQQARYRLSFDELFLIQLSALIRKNEWLKKTKGRKLTVNKEKNLEFVKKLPFNLTKAQERCIEEILSDLQKETPMNRLLVGDVGSGKTVVAAISAFVACQNGLQTLFMAPTQILANQHFETLKKLFAPFDVEIELVTGGQRKKIKAKENDKNQEKIIVGTHALLNRDFDNVGLVIIDEQHRFGVEQRALLSQKGITPHVLTMTATPIPRTIVLTLYNDLDLSVIDEMPPGRAITKTWVVPNTKRNDAYEWIRKKVKGTQEQSFIICPLVEESESLSSVKAATKEFTKLTESVFPDLKLGLLHGRIKLEEKNRVLKDFCEGKLDILVATPVVEVGIDIPNATIMIIEAADRFGLAQLHQLRGRIGRRNLESYCFLFSENENPLVQQRLKSLEKTNLGIELAEIDLRTRGPGEIYGTKQHGFYGLKIASYSDLGLIKKTSFVATSFLNSHFSLLTPTLNSALQSRLEKYKIEDVINN